MNNGENSRGETWDPSEQEEDRCAAMRAEEVGVSKSYTPGALTVGIPGISLDG